MKIISQFISKLLVKVLLLFLDIFNLKRLIFIAGKIQRRISNLLLKIVTTSFPDSINVIPNKNEKRLG